VIVGLGNKERQDWRAIEGKVKGRWEGKNNEEPKDRGIERESLRKLAKKGMKCTI
jgi:hypothetical protein